MNDFTGGTQVISPTLPPTYTHLPPTLPPPTPQVIEVRDEAGKLMNDFTGRVKFDERKHPDGFARTLVVAMDTAQVRGRGRRMGRGSGGRGRGRRGRACTI